MIRVSPRVGRACLAGAGLFAIAALAIALRNGVALQVGPIALRAHSPTRALVIAALLAAIAAAAGRTVVSDALAAWWDAIERRAALGAAACAVATVLIGVAWGAFVAGGSDSYCYLNQAELFARGTVRDHEPLARDTSWPGSVWAFAPAGHNPAPGDRGAMVPICPPGYPLLLAAVRTMFGRTGMFLVTPLCGGLTVYLAFLLGRRAGGSAAGLLTATLTAFSPILLYQVVQPMNDVPAAAAWCAALLLASGGLPDRQRAALTGSAVGAALAIRPNLVPLAVVVALGAALLPRERTLTQRVAVLGLVSAAAIPGILFVMTIQQAMYGSALRSGYGDLSELFALSHVGPNMRRYPAWLVETHTPIVVAALAAPAILPVRRFAVWLLAFAAATLACYLPYVVFEAWWYLRFLLPAIPAVLALASGVAAIVIGRAPVAARVPALVAVCAVLAVSSLGVATKRDVFRIAQLESRFRAGGEYVARLPPNAAVVTGHHSGSIRFYSGRSAAGWQDIDPGRLEEAMAFLRRHGRKPYLVLEDWEEPQFRERFGKDRLGALDWPALAEIGTRVRIYDPDDRDRHARGEVVRTDRIAPGR